ncbi:MAG: response regulator [Caldilineaceae bacterium]|nr:response regulator [Caldilineaceae bacterium]
MTDSQTAILLIDDDAIDREQVRRLLDQNFVLAEATNGHEGLAAIQQQAPDLVLLDYRLPDVDSFELLEQLVAAEAPVIVLTGEEHPDVIVAAMQRGAHDYLFKGQLSRVSLERAIHNALEKAAMRSDLASQQRQLIEQAEMLVEQNRQIRTLASAVTLAEQRERKRIAQILHDHVQQLLYGVQMRLHLLTTDTKEGALASVQENLAQSAKLLRQAIDSTRSLAVDLSPPVLHDEGVQVALQWLVAHIERVHGLHVELQVEPDFEYNVQSEELYVLIFQLVRELLFNVVKHANVNNALVRLYSQDERKLIAVEDEGVGFEAGQVVKPKWQPEQGYGLYSVRERLALFGGQLEVDSHPGNGARITVILPESIAI